MRPIPNRASLLSLSATIFLLMLPLLLATPRPAFGYADPGSGAFLYQAAYAAFLGGAFYVRKLLNRFFGKTKPQIAPTAGADLSSAPASDDLG